jgi:signal transduction histidine kinase
MRKNNSDERVFVVAPIGQDARVMADLFIANGFDAHVSSGPEECSVQINAGAGAMVFTEEVLEMVGTSDLLDALRAQPRWSELPIIILTVGTKSQQDRLLELAKAAAGTVTLLERPIRGTTLLRSLEVALNSRRRQYQVRDLFEQQRHIEMQLRQAHEQLADRARQLESLVKARTIKLAQVIERLEHEMQERQHAEAVRDALRRQLLGAQEEERRRIARELHDQMGQSLTALNLGLRSLRDAAPKNQKLRALVHPLQELAAQTARDVHRVALELRPAALDDLGLVKAIRNLAETWASHFQIEVDFEAERYKSDGISSEIETTLYRVIQEALNNVAKHSGARTVSLVLHRTPNHVQTIIEDDGRGFDTAAAIRKANDGRRLGLVGIQERLGMIGGTLNVESTPNHGATLIIRIPVPTGT